MGLFFFALLRPTFAVLFRLILNKHPLRACDTCAHVFIYIVIIYIYIYNYDTHKQEASCLLTYYLCVFLLTTLHYTMDNINRVMFLSFVACPFVRFMMQRPHYIITLRPHYLLTTYYACIPFAHYLIYIYIVFVTYYLPTYYLKTVNRPYYTVSRYLLAF